MKIFDVFFSLLSILCVFVSSMMIPVRYTGLCYLAVDLLFSIHWVKFDIEKLSIIILTDRSVSIG